MLTSQVALAINFCVNGNAHNNLWGKNALPTFACSIRVDSSLDANPPNTSECIAPSLAVANIATIASGIIGI